MNTVIVELEPYLPKLLDPSRGASSHGEPINHQQKTTRNTMQADGGRTISKDLLRGSAQVSREKPRMAASILNAALCRKECLISLCNSKLITGPIPISRLQASGMLESADQDAWQAGDTEGINSTSDV